jgi:hypothetical protein
MPFSFFNPWFWLAAGAVAAPVWLHLRRKRQSDVVPFSTLRFLDDQPAPRRAPLRLRHLVLLALRVLALLLVVGAFCWPYSPGTDAPSIRESRVYVLDNTLSHQANDGFGQDRERVLGGIARAGGDVQVAVVELAGTPRVVVSFSDDRQTALRKVRELRPSFQRGSYLAAFRQANGLLANSLGQEKRIVFLGDNQANQWNENVHTPPFLGGVQVELPKPATGRLPNLSLSDARAQRLFLGDKSLVNLTIKLTHTGAARSANFILRANGQVLSNREVELEGQPESILLQAQWEAEPASWLRGEAVVEGQPDALAGDNRVFFSLAPVTEGKVALLAQSPYLRLALSPEVMRGRWATRVLEPSRLKAEVAAGQDADVLCLESNYLQSSEARALLWRYLSNGRGVILLLNRVTPTIRGSLRELGFEADESIDASERGEEKFQFVLSNHPVFHPFLSPDYGNLMEVKVYKFIRLRSTQALPLIFSETGAGLFFQGTKSQGKLFVAAFGLDREHTSWPVHQTFVPFLDLTLQAARAEDPTPTSFEPGEVSLIQLPGGAAAREVVLRDEARELARFSVEQGRARVRLPDQPGLYALTYDDRPQVQEILSVNPSPKESELAYVESPEALRAWRLTSVASAARTAAAGPGARIPVSGILQQRWWWWMVLAGLAALMLEMVLAEMRKERA